HWLFRCGRRRNCKSDYCQDNSNHQFHLSSPSSFIGSWTLDVERSIPTFNFQLPTFNFQRRQMLPSSSPPPRASLSPSPASSLSIALSMTSRLFPLTRTARSD